MARFSKAEVVKRMEETVMIPVFNSDDLEICKKILDSCYAAGLRVFEFTNRSENALQIFHEVNIHVEKNLPEMMLGAGSILDADTTSLYIKEGAGFIVSPALKESMAERCNDSKILWIPGCGTVTEISKAEEEGAEIVKLFPGSVLGPAFIKALKGPMPRTKLMVTGGIETEEGNIKEWLSAGASCLGFGSQLFTKEIIQEKKFHLLEEKIKEVLQIIKKIKNKL